MDVHQELLSVLSETLKYAPDFRLGQLICVLTGRVDHPYSEQNVIYDIEDAELLPAAKEFRDVMRRRYEEMNREQKADD